jgi:sugar phosphate permease
MITFGVSIVSWFLLPSSPATTTMLNEREREFIMTRSKRLTAGRAKEEATKGKLIWRAFVNPHVWFGLIPWFCAQILASSLTFFLSIILVEEFGYTADQANVRNAATFFVSVGVTIIIGFLADKTGKHAPFVIFVMLLAMVGMAMFAYAPNPSARYAGAFLGNIGAFSRLSTLSLFKPAGIFGATGQLSY